MNGIHLPIELDQRQAEMVSRWLKFGRVRYWMNVDLSCAGGFYLSPTHHDNGDEATIHKPHWRASDIASAEFFSPLAFVVVSRVEVKRFYVAVRRGAQGLSVKLTDAASRRVRAACAKAGEGSSYHFDFATQEAVITVRDKCIPLDEWMQPQKEAG